MSSVLPMKAEPRKTFELSIDEIAKEGARQLLMQALNLEVDECIEEFKTEVNESGKRLVVRNGAARARKVTMPSGTAEIQAPRIHDHREGVNKT